MKKEKINGANKKSLERALVIIERRWSCRLLQALLNGERRFSELQDDLENITPRMLSRRLREFEENDLVEARFERRPHRVYYRLKSGAKEVRDMLAAIHKWGRKVR